MTNETTPGALGSNAELGLVERLRQQGTDCDWNGVDGGAQRDPLLHEAADEIERLRFELGYAQGQINQAEADQAKAVAAERERCAKVADEHARRTFAWASENSDRYHAQADWAEAIAKSIRQLKA